ncbi:nucleotidyltransferase [Aeromonas dhakensis]|uniref:nucleotidyltransferase n=1 Tax=Aeromonas TaxID=642 RepID=UPI0020B27D7B|nr:nucleotidyltransferase [Aeromonas dhakensis]HDX8389985.1 nucleotidyltransferase [Aeromonas dhakensis]HDX8399002.1 nucleotidyltransferase [Aeromonas dhakensis]HDX8412533.1 nucleotidyltransferase [Aeromonas dhakensis]HDX8449363.1 nucleotidyltransferase [Aeromonas dhakensis]HDX8458564.1 nucleotidyltransferase [Aeromonas dhakensis]
MNMVAKDSASLNVGDMMPTTVNGAFDSFMSNVVNLDSAKTTTARASRDFLKGKILSFDDFFPLYSEKNIDFGSFARRTKIRPLDDIDMIFTLSAHGCTWEETYDGTVYMNTPSDSPEYKDFRHDNSYRLNSRKVINHFIRKLSSLAHYQSAALHRNLNAATLKLTSYDWNFDIVPAFFTKEDLAGNTYYIIPNGSGNWMKTDPRLDSKRTTYINQQNNGYVLNAIRAIKYWQRRPTMPSMSSYLLENMILNHFEQAGRAHEFVDLNIIDILQYISIKVWSPVNDPKGIQGNLNNLSFDDKVKISTKAATDFQTALSAREYEQINDHEKAIREWKNIFGQDFPQYG